jgi:hypothetical protein
MKRTAENTDWMCQMLSNAEKITIFPSKAIKSKTADDNRPILRAERVPTPFRPSPVMGRPFSFFDFSRK